MARDLTLSPLAEPSTHYLVNSVVSCSKDPVDGLYIFCSFPVLPLTKEIHHGSEICGNVEHDVAGVHKGHVLKNEMGRLPG